MKSPLFRLQPRHFALAIAGAALFVVLGHFATIEMIDAQRMRRLQELSETALHRAELVADYGQTSLDEVARRVGGGCSSSSLQELRLQVYRHSNLKDIRIIDQDGSVQCSAFSETLEFDRVWIRRADML